MIKKYFKLRNVVAIATCLAVSTAFAGCDPEDDPIDNPTDTVESVSLNKTTLTIAIGESATLAVITDPVNAKVTWTSSNANAVVDANCKVTGKAEGTAVITAKAGDKTAECTVTVREALINGVVWALRNVDAVGAFADKPESSGMFYQWNRKKAWAATGTVSDWDSSYPTGMEWAKANDPSPAGWRVPTRAEIQKLLETDKVSSEWTTQSGINGRKFTDKTNSASIFFPTVGGRSDSNGTLSNGVGKDGDYWGSTAGGDGHTAHHLSFNNGALFVGTSYTPYGFSVRPVLE